MGAAGEGRGGCIVNQAALPKPVNLANEVGTRPNDSSTELYKYSRAGLTRPLLLVAKKPRVFNDLLIVFNHTNVYRWSTHHWLPLFFEPDPGGQFTFKPTLPAGFNRALERHLNIYPQRKQFTYHWSERSSQMSPSDKHAVSVNWRPKCALAENWPA